MTNDESYAEGFNDGQREVRARLEKLVAEWACRGPAAASRGQRVRFAECARQLAEALNTREEPRA